MSGAAILLVDDDTVLCDIVERNLRARHFDLIVLDISLPDRSGWEVLREALHEGTLPPCELDGRKLPVVVLSAVQFSPRRMTEFRPLAYLPKPFPMDSLLRLAAEATQGRWRCD